MFHYPVAEHKGEPKEGRPERDVSGTADFDPKEMLQELWLKVCVFRSCVEGWACLQPFILRDDSVMIQIGRSIAMA